MFVYLAKRLGKLVYISYNLNGDNNFISGLVEKTLLGQCKKLFPAKNKQTDKKISSTTPTTTSSSSPANITSLEHTYPADHWAYDSSCFEDTSPYFIAKLRSHGHVYGVYLNPVDSRGYRSIVRLITQDPTLSDLKTTFNRPPTESERLGLAAALAVNIYFLY